MKIINITQDAVTMELERSDLAEFEELFRKSIGFADDNREYVLNATLANMFQLAQEACSRVETEQMLAQRRTPLNDVSATAD